MRFHFALSLKEGDMGCIQGEAANVKSEKRTDRNMFGK